MRQLLSHKEVTAQVSHTQNVEAMCTADYLSGNFG